MIVRSLLLLLLCTLGAGCVDSITQILVEIDADEAVREELTSIQLQIYDTVPDAEGHLQEVDSERISLPSGADAGQPGLGAGLLSFGIEKGKADRFLLVVLGLRREEVVIERKMVLSFSQGRKRKVTFHLGTSCLENLCGGAMQEEEWLTLTCDPDQGGQCQPTPEADKPEAGVPDADVPSREGGSDGSGLDASDGSMEDAGDGSKMDADVPPQDGGGDAEAGPTPPRDASPDADGGMDGSTNEAGPAAEAGPDAGPCADGGCVECGVGFEPAGDGGCFNPDDCRGHLCQNGSSCVDGLNAYTCACGASGYYGDRCDLDIDECQVANECTHADYPCAQSVAPGYICQGWRADWHMPDAQPGSKYAPNVDWTSTAGLVIDHVTGLIWQRDLPRVYMGCTATKDADGSHPSPQAGEICLLAEAKGYCNTLSLAGYDDWRLPTKIELESIVDETQFNPSIKREAFPDLPGNDSIGRVGQSFWASNAVPAIAGYAWTVNFVYGYSLADNAATGEYRVRCVRSNRVPAGVAKPSARYALDAANDLVSDARTGLVWQRSASASTLTWSDAKTYCTGLSGGFRLPSYKELLTLVDPLRDSPALDPIFASPAREFFWSASPDVDPLVTGYAWHVSAWYGDSNIEPISSLDRVRCVR
jgi:hypothetical protein